MRFRIASGRTVTLLALLLLAPAIRAGADTVEPDGEPTRPAALEADDPAAPSDPDRVETPRSRLDEAGSAFADLANQSPQAPLVDSAQNLRRALGRLPEPGRRWQLGLTAGMEYDTDPRIAGDATNELPLPGGDADGRGVVRLEGRYRVVDGERVYLTAGFDGYWSFHLDETDVNRQTYNPWVSGGVQLGPVRVGLRYDYAYTLVDSSDAFRHLHRVTPSVSLRQGEWGATTVFYQYNDQDYLFEPVDPTSFDRDGHRQVVAASQLFFLPAPFSYVRIGGGADWQRSAGSEWDYDGLQASFGAGYDFDYGITFGWLYRFAYRHFQHQSALSAPPIKRDDFRHVLTVDIGKNLGRHWKLSLGGSFTWNDSDLGVYTYDRQIGGAYASYTF